MLNEGVEIWNIFTEDSTTGKRYNEKIVMGRTSTLNKYIDIIRAKNAAYQYKIIKPTEILEYDVDALQNAIKNRDVAMERFIDAKRELEIARTILSGHNIENI